MKFLMPLILFSTISFLTYGQELARIINRETSYIISGSDEAEIIDRVEIQINEKRGNTFSFYRDYIDQFRKVKSVSITVLDKTGKKVKKLNKGDGIEIGFSPSYEINDSKVLIIDPDYQQYPYRLIIESKVQLDGFTSLPTWLPRYDFRLAVDNAKLIVKSAEGIILNFRDENITPLNVSKTDDWKIVSYEVKGLEHQNKNIRYKDFYDMQPKVLIAPEIFELDGQSGSMNSWAEFGDWFLNLNNSNYELSEETVGYLNRIKTKSRKDKIKEIYHYMQDRTRYVSIQLGIGGFKSLPSEDVDAYGYGDCKALTTYMKNMLDYVGIKSNYILVKAGRDVPDVIDQFTSNQFNHVFLGIPNDKDTILLECTSQIMPPDYIGQFTDNRNVLWVETNKSEIIRSRIYSLENNLKVNSLKIALDKDGNATIDQRVENKGVFYDEIMLYKSGQDDYIKQYNQNKFNYKDATIKDFSFRQPNRDEALFFSNYELEVNGLAKKLGERLILPLKVSNSFSDFIDKDDYKGYAHIKRGMTIRDTIQIDLPDDYYISNLPEKAEVKSEFGNYDMVIKQKGSTFFIYKSMIIYSGDYTGDALLKFQKYFEEIENIERQKLVFNNRT